MKMWASLGILNLKWLPEELKLYAPGGASWPMVKSTLSTSFQM